MKLVSDDGIEIAEINKIVLNPGDVLLVKIKAKKISEASKSMVGKTLKETFPDNKYLLIDPDDIEFEVMGKEDIPELKPLKYEIDDEDI